jgi:hypothetical protein
MGQIGKPEVEVPERVPDPRVKPVPEKVPEPVPQKVPEKVPA